MKLKPDSSGGSILFSGSSFHSSQKFCSLRNSLLLLVVDNTITHLVFICTFTHCEKKSIFWNNLQNLHYFAHDTNYLSMSTSNDTYTLRHVHMRTNLLKHNLTYFKTLRKKLRSTGTPEDELDCKAKINKWKLDFTVPSWHLPKYDFVSSKLLLLCNQKVKTKNP